MTEAGFLTARPPLWRRVIGVNLLTAVVLGIGGYLLGAWLGDRITGPSLDYFADTGENDIALALGYLLGVLGFLVGLGFANYPVGRLVGRPPSLPRPETEGIGRYFRLCPDHKVVGMQYFVGVGLFFFIAGLNAMLIRVELLHPEQSIWPPDNYLTLVGLHGSMMMGVMTSVVLGPFANYLVPLMIGARRSAVPRIESLSFWLLVAAGVILMTSLEYLAERSARRANVERVGTLVAGATRVRRAGQSLSALGRITEGDTSLARCGSNLDDEVHALRSWFVALGDSLVHATAAPPPHSRDTEGRRRLLECVREAVASGDKTKLRPALVLLWASQHLDNLWRLESHLGRDAPRLESR